MGISLTTAWWSAAPVKPNISLRTGCFCNPGGGELALGISAEELTSALPAPESD